MPTNVRSSRWSQIVAWIVASLFVLGFFYSPVGEWTGPILGVWFAGTQKPRRGFLWMMAFSFIPHWLATGASSCTPVLSGRSNMLPGFSWPRCSP